MVWIIMWLRLALGPDSSVEAARSTELWILIYSFNYHFLLVLEESSPGQPSFMSRRQTYMPQKPSTVQYYYSILYP